MTKSLLFCCALAIGANAQKFEVASIKPNAENDSRVMMRIQPGGRFVATGIPVKELIGYAYNMRRFQISGGPGWIESDRYDINAKAESAGPELTQDEVRAMVRALLEERFKLKVRNESKEMPIYALVVGKNGPKLKKSDAGGAGRPNGMVRMGRGEINGQGMSMAMLAQQVAQQLGRTVVDRTGLDGQYEVELKWMPEPGQGSPMRLPGGPDALPPVDHSGPTIFTALQEQLGLRLDSQRGPVPAIVIESIDKPSEN